MSTASIGRKGIYSVQIPRVNLSTAYMVSTACFTNCGRIAAEN